MKFEAAIFDLLLRLLKVNVLIAVILNIFQLSMLKKAGYFFTVFL